MKVHPEEDARVLVSGVDTLRLAVNVDWGEKPALFDELARLKVASQTDEKPAVGIVRPMDGSAEWPYTVQPHGADGYEWVLSSGSYSLSILNREEPGSRPSVMVQIRAETLWTHGTDPAMARALALLEAMGGIVLEAKLSRVDPCVDLLIPRSWWHDGLREQFITRARKIDPHFDNGRFTGINIGRGIMAARLYDKTEEIQTVSRKFWMLPVWGIAQPPDGFMVLRVEFQVQRERLKEFGLNRMDDLSPKLAGLWAACTRNWLRLVEDSTLHHTQQRLTPL